MDVFNDHKTLQYFFTQKEFNVQQRTWLELFKDYYMSVIYNPIKAKVVKDALSRINMCSISHLNKAKKDLAREVHTLSKLWVRFGISPEAGSIIHYNSELSLVVTVNSK